MATPRSEAALSAAARSTIPSDSDGDARPEFLRLRAGSRECGEGASGRGRRACCSPRPRPIGRSHARMALVWRCGCAQVVVASSTGGPGVPSPGGGAPGGAGGHGATPIARQTRASKRAKAPGLFEVRVVRGRTPRVATAPPEAEQQQPAAAAAAAQAAAAAASSSKQQQQQQQQQQATSTPPCARARSWCRPQVTPPPRSLGIYALPPLTHNGEQIEVDGQEFVGEQGSQDVRHAHWEQQGSHAPRGSLACQLRRTATRVLMPVWCAACHGRSHVGRGADEAEQGAHGACAN